MYMDVSASETQYFKYDNCFVRLYHAFGFWANGIRLCREVRALLFVVEEAAPDRELLQRRRAPAL